MSAVGSMVSAIALLMAGADSVPRAALQHLVLIPIAVVIAKKLLVLNHYLHSLPGGTILAFGVFLDGRLLGVITFGAGPANAYRLIDGASRPEGPQNLSSLKLSRLKAELPKHGPGGCVSSIDQLSRRPTTA